MWRVEDLNFAQQRLTIHRVKRSLPGLYPLRADEVTALTAYLRERKSPAPTLSLATRHLDFPPAARDPDEPLGRAR